MAKDKKLKSTKKSLGIFKAVVKASVKNNPASKKNDKKAN
jgi:hypothetical protein